MMCGVTHFPESGLVYPLSDWPPAGWKEKPQSGEPLSRIPPHQATRAVCKVKRSLSILTMKQQHHCREEGFLHGHSAGVRYGLQYIQGAISVVAFKLVFGSSWMQLLVPPAARHCWAMAGATPPREGMSGIISFSEQAAFRLLWEPHHTNM